MLVRLIFRVRQDNPATMDVNEGGQIEVKGKLDHETRCSSRHTVTLTANDGSGTSNNRATIMVTIYVTDVDEKLRR